MNYNFVLIDLETIKRLVKKNRNLIPYKKVGENKFIRWNSRHVTSQVIQGIMAGEAIPKISKRFQNVLNMNRASSIRNARTSMTSAQNSGRLESYREAERHGIEMKKKWMATFDGRERDWHADLDGVMVGVDEPFVNEVEVRKGETITDHIMYPGDPSAEPANVYNCRCTMVVALKGIDYD